MLFLTFIYVSRKNELYAKSVFAKKNQSGGGNDVYVRFLTNLANGRKFCMINQNCVYMCVCVYVCVCVNECVCVGGQEMKRIATI